MIFLQQYVMKKLIWFFVLLAEMIHIDFFHICLKTMNLKKLLKKQKREKYFLDFQILQ